jgi:hypothetical protein
MRRTLLLFPVLSLVACSSTTEPHEGVRMAAERAEARWLDMRPAGYRMVQIRSCECVYLGAVRVDVGVLADRTGADEYIANAEIAATGEPVTAEDQAGLLTVEQLFDLIRAAVDEGVFALDAEFHPTLGYPVSVFVDHQRDVADDEVQYRIDSLEVMPGPQ